MNYQYHPCGTCSRLINYEIKEDGTIGDVSFVGGCNGNLQGIAALLRGMKAEDAIARLKGIRCGSKPTSCPDQLACALTETLNS